MKATDKAAKQTPEFFPKKRGRPTTGKALTGSQRAAKLREQRKAQGLCTCCGQSLPDKP